MKTNNLNVIGSIFNICEKLAPIQDGSIHILDLSTDEMELQFRIYHKDGYCIDVFKQAEEIDDNGDVIAWSYDSYQEWDGFDKRIPYDKLLEILMAIK